MGEKSFGYGYIGNVEKYPNEAGGMTLVLGNTCSWDKVNWNDFSNVKITASKALDIAEGFYNLIHSNCSFDDMVFSNKNIEIYISLGAFACELYLKAMIYLDNRHGGKKVRSHKLNDLVSKLSDETKEELYGIDDTWVGKIDELADSFTEMRYMFEYNALNKEYLSIFDLLEALKKVSEKYEKESISVFRYSGGKLVVE